MPAAGLVTLTFVTLHHDQLMQDNWRQSGALVWVRITWDMLPIIPDPARNVLKLIHQKGLDRDEGQIGSCITYLHPIKLNGLLTFNSD